MQPDQEPPAGRRLHPGLNLPYGRWLPIGEQRRSGAMFFYKISKEKVALVNEMISTGYAFAAVRRKSWDKSSPDFQIFERVIWLKG